MKIHSEIDRKLDDELRLSNKGYTIAVAIALIFVFSLLIGYYFIASRPPEGYTAIYLLDSQQKNAINYPELIVINENSTFNVWVIVENHLGTRQSCEVLQKLVADPISSFPVEANAESTYTKNLENGETWETLAAISINEPGSYAVIFELWINDDEAGAFKFSYNYCILKIEAVD